MFVRFIIYGLVGLSLEVAFTAINSLFTVGDKNLSGFSSLWMIPVYGLGVVFEKVHLKMDAAKIHWFHRGVIWMILIWAVEYAVGTMYKNILGISPWTYDGKYAVDGLVRLDYGPLWFICGLFFEKLHDILVFVQWAVRRTR